MKHDRAIWNGLIAIEGIDGAGTTTLCRLLADALKACKRHFVSGNEPTDGPVGQLIREALEGRVTILPKILAILFSADRNEHLFSSNGIRDHLDSGALYITDRYFFSSLAYQSLDLDWEWVESINAYYPLPSHLIFLGIPVKKAIDRLSDRKSLDIFEHASLQHRVLQGYQKALDAYRDSKMKILELDSRETPEKLCDASMKFIADLL